MKRGAALLALLFGVVLIRTAWLSDDVLISLRSVLNVTHGFGLTFNISERVQTFTHPLWMLPLTAGYLTTGNVYFGTFLVSILTSLLAFWLIVRGAVSTSQAWLAAGLLIFSRAFVDYSTSGLENPLSNVLLALTVGVFLRPREDPRRLTWLATLASLLYLTRPDDVLLVAPLVVVAALEVRRPAAVIRSLALGSLPALAWTSFALVYYGFPFPNTAYAKLATGIHFGERWRQGLLYLVDSLDRDPLTLATIGVAVLVALAQRRREGLALSAGIALYILYVISIGGDFMAGRFLVLPFVASVLLLTRLAPLALPAAAPVYAVLLAAAIASGQWPLTSNGSYGDAQIRRSGIVDERAIYFAAKSLLRADRRTFLEPEWPRPDGQPHKLNVLETCGLMGSAGLDWGPYTHLLDECALADPLLARLPAVWNESWRIGHFRRLIPKGYRESLENGTNQIADPGVAALYDDIRAITRPESVWSADRWRRIGKLVRGKYPIVDWTFYRYGGEVARLEALGDPKPDGTPWDAEGNRVITVELAVLCGDKPGRRTIEISTDSDEAYRLTFVKQNRAVSWFQIDAVPEHRRKPGLVTHTIDIPPSAIEEGFDTIVILPGGNDNKRAIGHLRIN